MESGRQRVLVLTSTFPRWPGDHDPPFVVELSRRLAADFEIHVLAPHAPGAKTNEQMEGMQVTRFRYFWPRWETLAYDGGILARLKARPIRYLLMPFFLTAQFWALRRLLKQQRFDAIHAHWIVPQGLIAILARIGIPKQPPLVCTSHGGDLFSLRSRPLTAIKQFVLKRCDRITVVSQAMREQALALGVAPHKIDVVPMGVDLTNRFIPPARPRKPNSLLFVGRLVAKKGLATLLQAMPKVLARSPSANLTIVGDGPLAPELRRQAVKPGLTDKIHFIGSVDNNDLPNFYQAATIAVFPFVVAPDGDQEGFGLVLAEALGCECAVITTHMAAVHDIVTDGETANLVSPESADRLADKIIHLLADPRRCRELGQAGRRSVLRRFDWTVIARRYGALLGDLVNETPVQRISGG